MILHFVNKLLLFNFHLKGRYWSTIELNIHNTLDLLLKITKVCYSCIDGTIVKLLLKITHEQANQG